MAETFEVAPWLHSLPCAPEFRPTEAEFADPVAYISKIEAEARTFGICKIVPPFPRASKRTVMANLNRSLLLQTSDSSSSSAAHSSSSLEPGLRRSMGGCMPPQKVGRRSTGACGPPFPHPRTRSAPPSSFIDGEDELKAKFNTRRQQLGCSTGKRSKVPVHTLAQKLVWQSGESYTLENFEAKAKQFARARLKTSKDLPPFVIESLFWKAAAERSITVEYGNDIPGSAFGEPAQLSAVDPIPGNKRKRSLEEENLGFPLHHPAKESKLHDSRLENFENSFSSLCCSGETASSCGTSSSGKLPCGFAKGRLRPRKKIGRADVHGCLARSDLTNSFWNMKVLPRAPGSLLRYMPDEVPGVTSPMVYIGMLFSWFAWHVEDHELHSLNYLHIGAPKTWYAVPGDAAPALEEVVQVYGYGNFLDPKASFTLLGEKTTVMSPEVLLAAGVPCCRLVQNAGEFVVTFPRAYHLGFSHGFNCGEAANFASPAWLEVAKDAAIRRAIMDCLPMLSHQQLLYLLALSLPLRIPLALAFEPRSSRSKGIMSSPEEEVVKTVFINDVAHNNRLLGLLLDSGVMSCILLNDGPCLSPASSEHSKFSCSLPDKNLRTVNFMDEMLLEETCAVESKQKHAGVSKGHCIPLQELRHSIRTLDMQTTRRLSFCWGTLPCAACGLLLFPSMVMVQPVSSLGKSQQLDTVNNASLPSVFFKEEERNGTFTDHLESLSPLNNFDLQSQYAKVPLSEPLHQPVALSTAEGKPWLWEMKHEGLQRLDKSSNGSNRKSLDHSWSGEIGNATAVQHDIEETEQFLGMPNICRENILNDYVTRKTANMELNDEIISVEQKEKSISWGASDDMKSAAHTVTETQSVASVLDLLAVTYNDESEDSDLHRIHRRTHLPDVDHCGICFHPDSSLLPGVEVGCKLDTPWHPVKKEAESSISLGGFSKLQSFDCGFATSSTDPDKLLPKEVLLQAGGCSFMTTDCLSKVEPCSCCLQGVPKCMSQGKMKHMLAVTSNIVKKELYSFLPGGQSCLDMPTGIRENSSSLDNASQRSAQLLKGLERTDCGESRKTLHSPLVNQLPANNSQPCISEISNMGKDQILSNSGRQVQGTRDDNNLAILIEKSDSMNFGQACTVDTCEGQTDDSHIPSNENFISDVCSDGANNSQISGNLDSSVNWMHIEPHAIFDGSSNLEIDKRKPIEEPKYQLKSQTKDLFMPNTGNWTMAAGDTACLEAPYGHDSPCTPVRPRFMCLEHALEAHHHLKLRGGSQMLIICHSDIIKMESHAQCFGQELSLNHTWREIPYCEGKQEQKHLIDMAIKAEEEGEDESQDWVFQLGMSVGRCQNKTLPNLSLYGADVSHEARAEPLISTNDVTEDEAIGKRSMHRKVSVAGHWCGKVWMTDEVHPALGGSYTAHLQLQALQSTGRDCVDNGKDLSVEQTCAGTFKVNAKYEEDTNLMNSHVNVGFVEIERTDMKRGVAEHCIDSQAGSLRGTKHMEVPGERALHGDSALLDTSCLTSAVRKHTNSLEEPIDFSNQGGRDDCCTLQSSYCNTSNSNGGNSQVSDVNAFGHDGSDIDIWQDLDVGCYSQEVLSLDTIGRASDPMTVETCHELDAETQEDFIPGMLRRSSSPFDCAGFFFEGPNTRLRSRSVTKLVSMDDDDELSNMKHSEPLFSSGKRSKQPRQKPKKSAIKDLEEECGAYVCELDGCSMSFSSKHELNLHKRNTCTFSGCGKRFGSHKYLLQHRRVHLDDRPLKCPWKGCKMTFKWKWACTEHYRVHTGERPYVCPLPECGRTFRFVSDFSRHKRKTGHTK